MTSRRPPQNISKLVRSEVAALPRYQTGLSENEVKNRIGLDHFTRLASNENPFGSSILARRAAEKVVSDLWKYPDPNGSHLKNELSNVTGVDSGCIVVGNGSEELISLLCRACLSSGDRVVTVHPSFPLHEINPLELGARITAIPVTKNLKFDVERLSEEAGRRCKMLLFSTPSNPVGCILDGASLKTLCKAAGPETLVVIDEAYFEYAAILKEYPNSLDLLGNIDTPWVILRTFSKAYGLAGCRIGYGLFSHPWLAERIDTLRTPFNVNSVGQAAATAALKDNDHLRKSVSYNDRERKRVTDELRRRGFRVADSSANFVFIDSGRDSLLVAEELLKSGIIVKPWQASGYETFLRVTIGRQEDNDLFLNSIRPKTQYLV